MKLPSRLGLIALQVVLVLALAGRGALAADEDKFLGTWVLNPAKSSGPPGSVPTNATVVLSKVGSTMYKSATDMTMAGISGHTETTFATDGKDYAPVVTPSPPPGSPSVTQSFERVNATAYKGAVKVNGQTIATVLNEVSADSKTLTVTMTATGPAGSVVVTMVYDRR